MDGRRLGEAFAVLRNAASNPAEARRRVGRIALAAETGPEQAHITRMHALAGADHWPDRKLLITALDAETGEQEVFDRASGAPLPAAVAASTAFPGIYPPITIGGRRYMDGSLRSATSAGLAAGARTLVVIDPQAHLFPRELLDRELAVAAAHTVVTIEPDAASIRAFGPDLTDRTAWRPTRRVFAKPPMPQGDSAPPGAPDPARAETAQSQAEGSGRPSPLRGAAGALSSEDVSGTSGDRGDRFSWSRA
ncbi:patatin-like phospholipase family protein [Kitasatospora aburaviensis]